MKSNKQELYKPAPNCSKPAQAPGTQSRTTDHDTELFPQHDLYLHYEPYQSIKYETKQTAPTEKRLASVRLSAWKMTRSEIAVYGVTNGSGPGEFEYLCNRKRTSMYIVLSPVPLILIALVVMIPTVFVARKTKTTAAPIPITTVTTVTMSTTTTQTTTPTETRTTETTIYKSGMIIEKVLPNHILFGFELTISNNSIDYQNQKIVRCGRIHLSPDVLHRESTSASSILYCTGTLRPLYAVENTTVCRSRGLNGKKYLKWKQQATTVAGGNGNQFNQLSSPYGISVGQNKTIIIADYGNDRVVRWEWQAKKGTIVAGGKGRGNRTDQLHSPRDVIVAKDNQSIIIVDYSNRRVIRWFDQSPLNQQILINDIDCYGLAMDKEGYLYVSDVRKQEVRRWKEGESQGTIVAGGNGLGNRLNQLKWPSYLFVDDEQSIYVSDHGNHRVMKWRKDAKEGSIVAGGNREGNSLNQLWHPEGVIVDRWGQIYVADLGNNRVMRWREGDKEGGIVVGGNGYGQRLDQLSYPTGLSFDDEGNLYVADCGNDRIQKFDLILS
ncbi:unnamed protein product [Adineta ricciae]|uniref:Uncharacterized protein n=1 Tax=Adineta ricciae TaxID=249248 RepID=A0A815ZM30_ADIRI|nr:unnamed protein product [Adineta ricciae]